MGSAGIPRLASRCKVDRATGPHIPPLRPEIARRVQPLGLRRSGPLPSSPLRPSRGNGDSPPESRASSRKYFRRRVGRHLATPVRLVSPSCLIKPELLDTVIQIFVQRIDQRSCQFSFLFRTQLIELLTELRGISGHIHHSHGQSVGLSVFSSLSGITWPLTTKLSRAASAASAGAPCYASSRHRAPTTEPWLSSHCSQHVDTPGQAMTWNAWRQEAGPHRTGSS